ncbi:predicted integral membrane protein [Zymobacter palmae]|uniref:Predicted integral membrane protein n=2 Tax=Zymobacter palmae TaxID=33074 RepID=A0A348HES0_9GAMM|nr:predicted integral membrane protein [Zymobacter palmae]
MALQAHTHQGYTMTRSLHSGRHQTIALAITALLAGAPHAMAAPSGDGSDGEQVRLTLDLPMRTTLECMEILGNGASTQCVRAYTSAYEEARAHPPQYASRQQCETQHAQTVCEMNTSSRWVPIIIGMQLTLQGTLPATVVGQAQKEVTQQNTPARDTSRQLAKALIQEAPAAFSIAKSMPLFGDRDAALPLIEPVKHEAIATTQPVPEASSPAASTYPAAATPSESGLSSMVAPALAGAAVATALQSGASHKAPAPQPTATTPSASSYGSNGSYNSADYRYGAPPTPAYDNGRSSSGSTRPTSTAPTAASRQNSTLGNTLRQGAANNDDQQHAASGALSRGNTGSSTAARQGWGSSSSSGGSRFSSSSTSKSSGSTSRRSFFGKKR